LSAAGSIHEEEDNRLCPAQGGDLLVSLALETGARRSGQVRCGGLAHAEDERWGIAGDVELVAREDERAAWPCPREAVHSFLGGHVDRCYVDVCGLAEFLQARGEGVLGRWRASIRFLAYQC
jgi:ribosomal protein S27AE